jgi:hypothetical protein
MRSLNLARVFAYALFALPCAGFAASSNYTSPLTSLHDQRQHEKPLVVALEFYNNTSQEREVRIGDQQFVIHYGRSLHVTAPVGSVVRVYSNQNSKVNGQELMQVSSNDANRVIKLK